MALRTNTAALATIVLYLLSCHACVNTVHAAGECGKTPVSTAAVSLSPCLAAAKSAQAKVPPLCCSRITALLKNSPACLCAVFLSPMVKQAGVNPATAITVPKRCNIKNRPVGHKCGSYILP